MLGLQWNVPMVGLQMLQPVTIPLLVGQLHFKDQSLLLRSTSVTQAFRSGEDLVGHPVRRSTKFLSFAATITYSVFASSTATFGVSVSDVNIIFDQFWVS